MWVGLLVSQWDVDWAACEPVGCGLGMKGWLKRSSPLLKVTPGILGTL